MPCHGTPPVQHPTTATLHPEFPPPFVEKYQVAAHVSTKHWPPLDTNRRAGLACWAGTLEKKSRSLAAQAVQLHADQMIA